VIEEEVPDLHVLAKFLFPGVLVVLVLIVAAVLRGLNFVLAEINTSRSDS
jgi:hypothetical protein